MPDGVFTALSVYGVATTCVVVLLWVLQRRTGDAGIIDVAWGAGVAVGAVLFAVLGTAPGLRRGLLVIVAGLPAARLAGHLLVDRVIGGHEDGRYRALRSAWGAAFQRRLVGFYVAQALALTLLVAGYAVAASNPTPSPSPSDVAAVALAALALVGEGVADRQLARFRRDPANRGRVCDRGLWRWSRHPNYFFQWLLWFAPPLLAWGGPGAWFPWTAPALMLFLLLRVTGIPTEAQALRSRGDAYRRYQRTTSAFVPWPPREESA